MAFEISYIYQLMNKQRKLFSLLYFIPAILLILLLAFAGGKSIQIYLGQKNDDSKFESLKQLIETQDDGSLPQDGAKSSKKLKKYQKIYDKNHDFIAWLTVPGTKIDYPVMKTGEDDPEYYLRKDFDGNYSLGGTLFVGGGCNPDSQIFIIFGHNMDSGTMFGELDKFADPEFARKHREFSLDTLSEQRTYRVFAAFQTKLYTGNDSYFKYYDTIGDPDSIIYNETVERLRGISLIDLADTPQYPQQILYLSTCSYHTTNGRFVIAAYRVD